ncbi:MAG TPA: hypothetical protein VFD03_04975 [Clostridia bacterium]|nr:hypothetical protein [Clostridia bacterium]
MSLFSKRNDNSSKKVETVNEVPMVVSTKSVQEDLYLDSLAAVREKPVIISTKLRVVEKTMLLTAAFEYSCYILFADYKYDTFEYQNINRAYTLTKSFEFFKNVDKQVKKVYAIVEKDKTYDVEIQKDGLYVNSEKKVTLDRIVSINGIKI